MFETCFDVTAVQKNRFSSGQMGVVVHAPVQVECRLMPDDSGITKAQTG